MFEVLQTIGLPVASGGLGWERAGWWGMKWSFAEMRSGWWDEVLLFKRCDFKDGLINSAAVTQQVTLFQY